MKLTFLLNGPLCEMEFLLLIQFPLCHTEQKNERGTEEKGTEENSNNNSEIEIEPIMPPERFESGSHRILRKTS